MKKRMLTKEERGAVERQVNNFKVLVLKNLALIKECEIDKVGARAGLENYYDKLLVESKKGKKNYIEYVERKVKHFLLNEDLFVDGREVLVLMKLRKLEGENVQLEDGIKKLEEQLKTGVEVKK